MNILDLFIRTNILVQVNICILIIFSIISWGIIFNRVFLLNIEKRKIHMFENRFWSGIELPQLYKEMLTRWSQLSNSERIFCTGFKEFLRLYQIDSNYLPKTITDNTVRVMHNIMNRELKELERYIPLIGTIGSVSPYIGLLGTVLGIIHVFFELGGQSINIYPENMQQVIAPGIAEALISTSLGLFVAIPSVIAFNYLTIQINHIDQSYTNFMEEFIAILYSQVFLNPNTEKNQKKEHETD